ncbi:hypothetical protein F4777DRAFT_582702 [Nemania sp. FL0916]|nr:hypothetical protein F4777DRAFT_582702 [Nemania sp. FL0916]
MASKEKELTHDEIWDDSVLVDSWGKALEEYKKYHSIHRNGGNVNDLMKPDSQDENGVSDAKEDTHEMDGSSADARFETAPEMRAEIPDKGPRAQDGATQHGLPTVPSAPPAPASLFGTMRDEGLKKLLMSWYYAGYYTGYYEGQRDLPPNRAASG